MRFTITNDGITVVQDSGQTATVARGSANFEALRVALVRGDWAAAAANLTAGKAVGVWSSGLFSATADSVTYRGVKLPDGLSKRILDAVAGGESVAPFLRFWERLARNPSYRSVQMLYQFMSHANIPITEDGRFLAYKGVREDWSDQHSGTFDNRPGQRHEMPRNEVSDDPAIPCHAGFHVGSSAYAREFGKRVVVCVVDPADVVCVPRDCEQQKVRCCRYQVVGHYGDDLPSTLFIEPPPVDPIEPPPEGYSAADLMSVPMQDLRRIALGIGIVASDNQQTTSKAALVTQILLVTQARA